MKKTACFFCAALLLLGLLATPTAKAARATVVAPILRESPSCPLPCAAPLALRRGESGATGERLRRAFSGRLPVRREKRAALTPRERAAAWLSVMSDRQKVGQLLLARFPLSGAPALAGELQPGGYLLFARDVADLEPASLRALLESCQQSALIPMLMGVDEEGGEVVRVSRYPQYRAQPFPSPRRLLSQGGLKLVERDAAEKAALLRSLGFHLNVGPVCDIADDPAAFLYSRTAGGDAATVCGFVQSVVSVSQRGGVGSLLKHFPGYGNNADTHVGAAVDERPYETFLQSDFLPFAAGIKAGAGAVMVSHNVVACMDKSLPASLSPAVHEILRRELEFDGVIVTDDLAMAAVAQGADQGTLAVQAILAGNDLLCTSDPQRAAAALRKALEEGELPAARLDEAVTRVLLWKIQLGLIS